jgi:hypothetical protein
MKKYPILVCYFVFIAHLSKAQNNTSSDSTLLKQIELEMQDTAVATPRPMLSFNPDIGVIGDFRAAYISKGDKKIDAYLEETELSFRSVVDPYIRADFFFSFSRDPETKEYGVEVEEGFLTTLALPAQLQLKAGKFRQTIGRINPLHPHALPFADMPVAYTNYFGDEGLNDEGLSVSWLLPTTSVYQELVFETTAGLSESPVLKQSEVNRLQYLAHLKNVR